MRVTHVITRLIVGGAQENTVSTVLGLASHPELNVDLISGPTFGPEGSMEAAFTNHPDLLRIEPSLVRPVSPIDDLKALFGLTSRFRQTEPQIVHTHSGKAGIVGRLAAARAKVPIIIHTIHGPSFGPWQGALANSLFLKMERTAGKVTTHFIAVANAMIEQYLAAGISVRERCSRILSGFPLEPFINARNDLALRSRYNIGSDDFVIGKIARLFALKGHDDLFAAAPEIIRAVPKVKFLLVGGGPWEQRFRLRVKELGMEANFVFTGLVPPSQIPSFVGIMDVLAHLSLREGLPRALPQALAAAKPVVAYARDGAGEVCIDGRTGYLITPGNVSGFAAAVKNLALDPALCSRLGQAGQKMVQENFSVEKMVSDIYELYLKLDQDQKTRHTS